MNFLLVIKKHLVEKNNIFRWNMQYGNKTYRKIIGQNQILKINLILSNYHSLKKIEELFINTFEQAAFGIAHVGTNGNFIQINKKFYDI